MTKSHHKREITRRGSFDAQAAAQELTRCIKELGFCGALVNGFTQINEADSAVFYDLPQYRPFWARLRPRFMHCV